MHCSAPGSPQRFNSNAKLRTVSTAMITYVVRPDLIHNYNVHTLHLFVFLNVSGMPQITRIHFKIFLLPNPLTNIFLIYKKLDKISLLAHKTPNAKKSLLVYSFNIRILFYYYNPLHTVTWHTVITLLPFLKLRLL